MTTLKNTSRLRKMLFGFSLISILFLGCTTMTQPTRVPQPTQPVDFYSDFGDPKQDHFRIPLIKPYYVAGSSYPGGLGITLYHSETKRYDDNMRHVYGINGVAKFAVENGAIAVMTEKKRAGGLQWFVIVPDKQIEVGFDNESDFKKYIQAYNITEPSWFTIKEAYKQLELTGCLPWIPGCK